MTPDSTTHRPAFFQNLLTQWKTWRKPTASPHRQYPGLGARLHLIRRLPWDARLEALRAGLLVASPEEAPDIAIDLIELAVPPERGLFWERRVQRSEEALETLVGIWDRLPSESRQLARQVGRGRWAGAIEAILRSPEDPEECRGATLLAASLDEADLASSLARAIALPDPATKAAAEIGLLRQTMRSLGLASDLLEPELREVTPEFAPLLSTTGLDPGSGPVERAVLEMHLADAVWGFASHQRRLVLITALAALDLPGLSVARRDEGGAGGAARIRRLLLEPAHVAHRALRQVLRWSPAPLVRHRALLLLAEPTIAEAALERLTRADAIAEHEVVLASAHLARRPARRRALRALTLRAQPSPAGNPGTATPPGTTLGAGGSITSAPSLLSTTEHAPGAGIIPHGACVPDEASAAALSTSALEALPGFLRLIDADDQTRTALVEPLVAHESAAVRLASLPALPRAGLAHFCFDREPAIARSALRRWSTAGLGLRARVDGGERLRLATILRRSADPTIRALAAAEVERESAWIPGSPASRASAWRLALRDRDAFLTRLRAMIREAGSAGVEEASAGDHEARIARAIAALGMARRLGLVRVLGADLSDLLAPGAHCDARLAASAASALGDVDDVIGRAALRRALEHADPRVRANAVEAIGIQRLAIEDATTGRDRDHGTLIELKGDPHHRVRANAIRALLQSPPPAPKDRRARRGAAIEPKPRIYEPDAIEALASMLGDARPMHRLAGSWLAGRVLSGGRERLGESWHRLSTMVAQAGTQDPDDTVRRRAAHAAARISATVRARWAGATTALDGADAGAAPIGIELAPPDSHRETTAGLDLVPAEPANATGLAR